MSEEEDGAGHNLRSRFLFGELFLKEASQLRIKVPAPGAPVKAAAPKNPRVIEKDDDPGLHVLIQRQIRSLVKLSTYKPAEQFWLDTKYPALNAALGSRKKGLRYGRIIELRGPEHGGKTAVALMIAAMAQADGAGVGMIDVEQSRDKISTEQFGTRYKDIVRVWPKLIARKGRLPRRWNRQKELFQEAEAGMAAMAAAGLTKQYWFLDSIAMLRTRYQLMGSKKGRESGLQKLSGAGI